MCVSVCVCVSMCVCQCKCVCMYVHASASVYVRKYQWVRGIVIVCAREEKRHAMLTGLHRFGLCWQVCIGLGKAAPQLKAVGKESKERQDDDRFFFFLGGGELGQFNWISVSWHKVTVTHITQAGTQSTDNVSCANTMTKITLNFELTARKTQISTSFPLLLLGFFCLFVFSPGRGRGWKCGLLC